MWQRLGECLLAAGSVAPEALAQALQEQRRSPQRLGAVLRRRGDVTEGELLSALAKQLGVAWIDLTTATAVPPEVLARIPAKIATAYTVLPLSEVEGGVRVAMADAGNGPLVDELQLVLHCGVQPVLAGEEPLRGAIQRHYGLGASAVEQLLTEDSAPSREAGNAIEDLHAAAPEASIISFVNQLLRQAVTDRATDVHLEPYGPVMRVRERVDGVLYEIPVPAALAAFHQEVAARVKVMARLDVAERRLPQDGRMAVRVHGETVDVRVSVLPTAFGEGVDIRLLSSRMLYSLEELGLGSDALTGLSELIRSPHGIIFVTGPTGSGKTTTLYACLTRLNTPQQKLITIEDPIEYQVPGLTQIQVHPKIGLTFAQGLRSVLRHDPDVIMVGEVRDQETADITIRSALTGHLVFSTLHTNDAAGGVTRLLEMGVEPYLVASAVLCFIAQRLVRVVCSDCAEPAPAPPDAAAKLGLAELPHLRRGRGCPMCKGTGYRGRTAIYEFFDVTPAIQSRIAQRASSYELAREAQAGGMRSLRHDGGVKVLQGVTTPEEVLRVT